MEQDAYSQAFEREKKLITEQSKIRKRPAVDLRQEERYAVFNRLVTELFGGTMAPAGPDPLELEYFHRYFELDNCFTRQYESWWKPNYFLVGGLTYPITAESEPAPMGASLGWRIQLDGDSRRNAFLNSPWVRVCLPIRPGREKEAISWLGEHFEGDVGLDTDSGPVADLIRDIGERRVKEKNVGINGEDFVHVDTPAGPPPDDASEQLKVYPIIEEYEVTIPTEGFVYEELKVVDV